MTFTKIHDGRTYGYSTTGPKWRCDDCGRTGYGSSDYPAGANPNPGWGGNLGWARTCLNGHSPCPWCGKQQALRNDGTPRVHTRCPKRPDDAELLRLAVAEAQHNGRLGVRGPLDRTARELLTRLTDGAH